MLTKQDIRKNIAQLKHSFSAEQKDTESNEILHTLESLDCFRQASAILLYHSLPDEVNTHEFIKKWSNHKTILLPVVTGSELAVRKFSPDTMTKGAYGIEEPNGTDVTNYDTIELVIVPGVAFDKKGNRLGRGKGYYDKLLPKLTNAKKIGICYSFQLCEHIPNEKHDIPMDTVITKTLCSQ